MDTDHLVAWHAEQPERIMVAQIALGGERQAPQVGQGREVARIGDPASRRRAASGATAPSTRATHPRSRTNWSASIASRGRVSASGSRSPSRRLYLSVLARCLTLTSRRRARPRARSVRQGIGQRVPAKSVMDLDPSKSIEVTSVLGGLHVNYRRAA
jgi:hypothetical protein